jgi:hypothetical protein
MWKKSNRTNPFSSFIKIKPHQKVKNLRRSGIEPEAKPWKGFMLPLHQRRGDSQARKLHHKWSRSVTQSLQRTRVASGKFKSSAKVMSKLGQHQYNYL